MRDFGYLNTAILFNYSLFSTVMRLQEKGVEVVYNQRTHNVKQTVVDFFGAFEELVRHIPLDAVEAIVRRLRAARDRGAMIYVAGNGGSAATASHWVNDLGKATKRSGLPAIRVMSLSDNISWLTALANDEGYERVFSGQLENFARPGDVLIVISASGNSPNLVEAVDLARKRGLLTIGLLGFDGGVLKDKVDDCLWLPTEKGAYGLVESAHGLLCHVLTDCLAKELPGSGDKEEMFGVRRDGRIAGGIAE